MSVPQEVPQALRSKPHEVFGSRIAALQQLGIEGEALKAVVGGSTVFLTTKDAPQEQLAFLRDELGFTTEQVGGGRARGKMGLSQCPRIGERRRDLVGGMCVLGGGHNKHCVFDH
jgi:hypothetical protein